MLAEIEYLKNNLATPNRGEAVRQIKAKIQYLLDAKDWKNAESFFYEFAHSFNPVDNINGIIKDEFQIFVNSLLGLNPELPTLLILDHLTALPWFEHINDSEYRCGYIAENLATFGQDILKIRKLQEARSHYRKAHKGEDAARVQRLLSSEVRSFTWYPSARIDRENPFFEEIRRNVAENLKRWHDRSNENKFSDLVTDAMNIRPTPHQERQDEFQSIFTSGILEQAGVIQTVGLSPEDGRVDAGRMASSRERIDFESYEQLLLPFLSDFSAPVKEWLTLKEDENSVFQYVSDALNKNLKWDENAFLYFMEGMKAWLSNYPQIAQSFWLPFFESALRNRLEDLGEDVINPQQRHGIEDFVLFENLLRKAEKYYKLETVEYWRLLFSTKNGLGWNLRNSFCHGILPLSAMKQDMIAFAVFLAYLFLLVTLNNEIE
jgi:hypothetical protein